MDCTNYAAGAIPYRCVRVLCVAHKTLTLPLIILYFCLHFLTLHRKLPSILAWVRASVTGTDINIGETEALLEQASEIEKEYVDVDPLRFLLTSTARRWAPPCPALLVAFT